jgi:hypothetical protein
MCRIIRAGLAGVLILLPVSGTAQSRPNLSGDWTLVSATTSGTRGPREPDSSSGRAERPTTSNTASGAAFNCGRQCTIVQKGQTLTIDKALLGTSTTPAPAVTLQVDGRQLSVVDSFSPRREIPVTATWNGNRLEIVSSTGSRTVTQSLAIEAGQLVVVTSFTRDAARPVTFRYRKN